MHNEIHQIARHFFQKERLQDIPVAEIENFLAEYPYVASVRYLLAHHKYHNGDDARSELVTAGLYLNNPGWVDRLLHHYGQTAEAAAPVVERNAYGNGNNVGEADNSVNAADLNADNAEPLIDAADPDADRSDNLVNNGGPQAGDANGLAAAFELPEISDPVSIPVAEGGMAGADGAAGAEGSIAHADGVPEVGTQDFSPPAGKGNEFPAPEEGGAVPPTHETTSSEEREDDAPARVLNLGRGKVTETASDRPAADEPGKAAPKSAVVPPPGDGSPIVFQSYHTIDYFASQGIRLQPADLTGDKLGQQLKSFTEWLKSMKKLPSSSVDTPPSADDASRQQKVMRHAEISVEEKEVVTEAMAEVWAKQGNSGRAREIYEKLCLQNPGKNAYFAAKIEQLKQS